MSTSKEDLVSEGESAQSLLSEDNDHSFFKNEVRRKSCLGRLRPVLIHLFIFATYTVVFAAMYLNMQGENCHKDMIYSENNSYLGR